MQDIKKVKDFTKEEAEKICKANPHCSTCPFMRWRVDEQNQKHAQYCYWVLKKYFPKMDLRDIEESEIKIERK